MVNSHNFRRERISLENPLAKALNRSKLGELLRKAVPWDETRRDQTFRGSVLPSTRASRPSIRQPCQIQWQGDSDVHKERGQNQTHIADSTCRCLPTIQVGATCCYGRPSFSKIKLTEIERGTQPVPAISFAGCPSSLWEQFCWSRLGWGPAWSSPMQASSTCAGYFSRCVQWLQQAHQELLGRRHALLRFEFVKPLHMKEMVTWNSSRHEIVDRAACIIWHVRTTFAEVWCWRGLRTSETWLGMY